VLEAGLLEHTSGWAVGTRHSVVAEFPHHLSDAASVSDLQGFVTSAMFPLTIVLMGLSLYGSLLAMGFGADGLGGWPLGFRMTCGYSGCRTVRCGRLYNMQPLGLELINGTYSMWGGCVGGYR
jgi:hypothetical protein